MITSMSPNSLPRSYFAKCARVGVALFLASLVGGCGTDSTQSATTDQIVTTTLPAPSAFDAAQATVASIWSREAREAILRCIDTLDGSFAFLTTLDAELGETLTFDQALDACKEAQLQTDVDGIGRLDLAFRELFNTLAVEALGVKLYAAGGDLYPIDEAVLQATVDLFVQRATIALGE